MSESIGFEDNWNPEADGGNDAIAAGKGEEQHLDLPNHVANLIADAAASHAMSNGIDLLEKRLQQVTRHTSHLTPHTSHLTPHPKSFLLLSPAPTPPHTLPPRT